MSRQELIDAIRSNDYEVKESVGVVLTSVDDDNDVLPFSTLLTASRGTGITRGVLKRSSEKGRTVNINVKKYRVKVYQ